MKISSVFQKAKIENRKLFIPFIMGGDPDLITSTELIIDLADLGADIIELGVPFSDPVADGITNQRAAQRALKNNTSLQDCCDVVKKARANGCQVPIVLFTYFNPILQLGFVNFIKHLQAAKIDAVLIVDLPTEEAKDVALLLQKNNIGLVLLLAPTTSVSRIAASNKLASAFLYYVSYTGVTGSRDCLSSTLQLEIQHIKQHISQPLVVGFGISKLEDIKKISVMPVDGLVVGSALVRYLQSSNKQQAKTKLLKLAATFIKELSKSVSHES